MNNNYPAPQENPNLLGLLANDLPIQGGIQAVKDWWNSLNDLQKAGLINTPAGVAGDMQMYAEEPESRNAFNYAGTAVGSIPIVGLGAKQALKTLGNKVKANKQPRRSAVETEAMGLKHPIGLGKNLREPVDEVNFTTVDAGLPVPKQDIDFEGLEGSTLIGLLGDRTAAGKRLTGMNGMDFESPVDLRGGYDFARGGDGVWASGKGVVSSLNNRANDVLARGGDPVGVYLPMGHKATNFNTMAADATLEQMKQSRIPQTAKKAFDNAMRQKYPQWRGIDDPSSREMLDSVGDVRHEFMRLSQLDAFQDKGFPNPARTRVAITDPALMDTPNGMGGQSFMRLDGTTINPNNPHPTYDTTMGGEYLGGVNSGVPNSLLFPDFYNGRRMNDKMPNRDARSMEKSRPTQLVDSQWVDNIGQYLEGNSPVSLEGYNPRARVADPSSINMTDEAVPSQNGPHFGLLADMDKDVRQVYTDNNNWVGADGRDMVASAVGLDTLPTLRGATGVFKSQSKPDADFQLNPMNVGRVAGDGTDPALYDKVNTVQAFKGVADVQDGAAAHQLIDNNQGNSLRITPNKPYSADQLGQIAEYGDKTGAAFSDMGDGNFGLLDLPFGLERSPQVLTEELGGELGGLLGDARLQRGAETTWYNDYSDAWKQQNAGTGMATKQMLETMKKTPDEMIKIFGDPEIKRALKTRMAKDRSFAKEYPEAGENFSALKNFRSIVSNAKSSGADVYKALEKAIAEGHPALPSVLLAVPALAPLLGDQSEADQL